MNIIFRIAKAELRGFFYSPIAWLLTIVFFVVCGIQFVEPIANFSRVQDIMLGSDPNWQGFDGGAGLSFNLFTSTYRKVIENLYLFIPLLTMGIINKEVQSGSIKLLYSSPIRTRDIVMGKYLGLVVFNFVLLTCVAMFLAAGYFSIEHADYKWFLSALLAVFLLSNTYAAIGLFISSLTGYQIVAGIMTFAVFFALTAVRSLWQDYDFVRDLTYFLSISGRVEYMLAGLITSRDLFYFVLIIILFLAFTIIKIKSTQESRPKRLVFTRYMAVFLVVLTLGYFSSRPGYVGYLDVTANKLNTIHPATREVLDEMDGSPLSVTLYANLLGKNVSAGLPSFRNNYVWEFWEAMVRFYPNIRLEYEYYYDFKDGDSSVLKSFNVKSLHEAAEKMAEMLNIRMSLFKEPEEVREHIDLEPESYGLVMELEYKGKTAFLRTYSDDRIWPDQNHISGAIRRLTRDTIPRILFTSGHYERSPFRNGEHDFGEHTLNKDSRKSLLNKGVDVDTISLLRENIPANTAVLVVADPKSALDPVEQAKIAAWLKNGGNAIFHAEPGKQSMLQPILAQIGVHLEDGLIVTQNKHQLPDFIFSKFTKATSAMALEDKMFAHLKYGGKEPQINHVGSIDVGYNGTQGFTSAPILVFEGGEKSWIEKGPLVIDSAAPVFSAAEGDIKKKQYSVGIRLSRRINDKEQRIAVTGDADFMSGLRGNGGAMGVGIYSWALNNEYPVYHNVPRPEDKYMAIGKNAGKTLWLLFVYIIPALILLTGIIVLVRRKRK